MRTWVRSLSSLSGLSAMRCGVLRRHGLDPKLLWLWCRRSAAALNQSLAWELPYAKGLALKEKRKKRLELCTGRLSENGLSVQGNNSLQTRFPLSRFPKKISCHIDSHGGPVSFTHSFKIYSESSPFCPGWQSPRHLLSGLLQ